MSKRKGNAVITLLFFVALSAWYGSRIWNHHAVTVTGPVPACAWKSTDWIISKYSYICGGREAGYVYKRTDGLWTTGHSLDEYETKEQAMEEELKKVQP